MISWVLILNQIVKCAARSKGHILDLVLTSGFLPINVNLVDFHASDHKANVFNVPLSCPTGKPCANVLSCVLNTYYASKSFMWQQCSGPLANSLNTICLSFLDHFAPLKVRKKMHNPSP